MKRYDLDHDYGHCGMSEAADGDYVFYADHVEALAPAVRERDLAALMHPAVAGMSPAGAIGWLAIELAAAQSGGEKEPPYCKVCDGAGTISTGIAEASSTQCRFCDGTGYAAPAPVASPAALTDEQREKVRDAIAEAIGGSAYDCLRAWSAWGVGTMSQDDFALVVEDESRLAEITDAAIGAMPEPQWSLSDDQMDRVMRLTANFGRSYGYVGDREPGSRELVRKRMEEILAAQPAADAPVATQVDTAPMYKALMESRIALLAANSGAALKAIALIDAVLNAKPASSSRAEVEEQPSLKSPLTAYGMLVRALRIVAGATLMDMSNWMGVKPSRLSAMEFGRVPVSYQDAVDASGFFCARGVRVTLHALEAARESTILAAAEAPNGEGK